MLGYRSFSTSSVSLKVGCAMVKPVHHRVKVIKKLLSPRFPELKLSPTDPRSPKFRPEITHQDRVQEHIHNTLRSDLMLINYIHGEKPAEGLKRRQWDFTSPYHINRPARPPKGEKVPTPTIMPQSWKNVPGIEKVVVHSFVANCTSDPKLNIGVSLQLQQITGVKPQSVYAKTNLPSFGLRKGVKMGAKVELTGRDASQFLSTLTELVLPRITTFEGISNRAGSRYGTVSFGLKPEDVLYFPEIYYNQDAWAKRFGMDITIHTTAQLDREARQLLSGLGLPFVGTEREPKLTR
ncbi:unnamed protein product [Kuraishia capsulata CBS 1993]|uniref:Large ribosomal subunit protein uL5m n=1 Tax=Kuraishia capsulata CBS 1993 TaxID=1382522 RepID=W6MNM0_9ASCO|nr:uncharacterized protein KUCA_T00004246001 [Kuraishia capsulata CBS 1993]CDK28264.1 unnamed protein product [Kuraishia capsulata CBS 1993]